jgi:hypothetical protein
LTTYPLFHVGGKGLIPFHDYFLLKEQMQQNVSFVANAAVGRVGDAGAGLFERPQWRILLIEWAYAYTGFDSVAFVAVDSLEAQPTLPTDLTARCYLAWYRAYRGDTVGVRDQAERLAAEFARLNPSEGVCPAVVTAFVESWDTSRTDTPALDSLEQVMRAYPNYKHPGGSAMLVVARLARERGQFERALKAAGDALPRYHMTYYLHHRAPFLKEEGELAAILGDTAGAIEAFRKYLNIRVDPDPGVVQAEVDSVRAALEVLQAEWSGRD